MTVLVTGAAGFLGRAVVARLCARDGLRVRALVRRPSQAAGLEALSRPDAGTTVEVVVGDLLTPGVAEAAVAGVDTVYHLAAAMRGSVSDMVMGTVVASQRLLRAMAAVNSRARTVLVSSFAVYGTADLEPGALVDETTPLEARTTERGGYAYAKLRQEKLFVDHCAQLDASLVIIRPGVVYGPGGVTFNTRVGIQLPGLFLHLGGGNVIPFTYVDNCAEGIVVAGMLPEDTGRGIFNVVDDDPLTSRQFLRAYRRRVRRMRFVSIPYWAIRLISRWVESYHRRSRGQLPAYFTPYMTASNWKGCRFSNARLKAIGWKPLLSTREGMERTFDHLRREARETRG